MKRITKHNGDLGKNEGTVISFHCTHILLVKRDRQTDRDKDREKQRETEREFGL